MHFNSLYFSCPDLMFYIVELEITIHFSQNLVSSEFIIAILINMMKNILWEGKEFFSLFLLQLKHGSFTEYLLVKFYGN